MKKSSLCQIHYGYSELGIIKYFPKLHLNMMPKDSHSILMFKYSKHKIFSKFFHKPIPHNYNAV